MRDGRRSATFVLALRVQDTGRRLEHVGALYEHMFVLVEPSILHADLDAFYASVEQRDDPSLRGRPVIVGAGVVLAASYEAKAYGVRTAMSVAQARHLCPPAIVVPPRLSAYTAASRDVFDVFRRTTPLVEGLSIDEAFLDVSGLRQLVGPAADIAADLRRQVREHVGLPITVGVATTKFLAKVASGVAKPDGLLVVPAGGELAFLHPLPVERLWGVGPVTAAKLRERGIRTVGDVARAGEPALVAMLGRALGRRVYALAFARDPRPVQVGRRRRSIGAQRALRRQQATSATVGATIVALADRVTRRMRAAGRVGRTVVLRLRFGDFTRATRSLTLPHPTARTDTILAAARRLLADARPLTERRGLTLIGLAVTNLADIRSIPAVQLPLPLEEPHAAGHLARTTPAAGTAHRGELPGLGHVDSALDAAVDGVRSRFGTSAITRAVLLGRDTGITVPLLPD
ncbi:DNA polymerase IV [Thermasporomyces composti]|uniref:DNA polymerase IV n=1 Tax=Thermasporomyces composti TaxID=696763 RepID=A0A3D9VET7_THECX|nr:DNA polymerase-4 [Thermasporomyces composti]